MTIIGTRNPNLLARSVQAAISHIRENRTLRYVSKPDPASSDHTNQWGAYCDDKHLVARQIKLGEAQLAVVEGPNGNRFVIIGGKIALSDLRTLQSLAKDGNGNSIPLVNIPFLSQIEKRKLGTAFQSVSL